jgi:general secretion pathway protein D
VNLYLDPQGLAEEGVTTDTPVTIDLRQEIMLRSALNLILQPLHLSYVIKDEVLKITSEQMRDGQVYMVTYYVGDLVQPIPNFVPGSTGLDGAYQSAMGAVGFGGTMPFGSSQAAPMVVARDGKTNTAASNPEVLAQLSGAGRPGMPNVPKTSPAGGGPGGMGGGVQPDFDSLIDLIKSTVKPTSWDDVGGAGSIAPFDTNLSLVVSQTQEVHEEIADLLDQLRRLQDLQVTIEVRFITLNDNFFEKIGVSFDFNINDNIDNVNPAYPTFQLQNQNPITGTAYNAGYPRNYANVDTNRTVAVGMSTPTTFNGDLDIPFTQNSFSLAVPQFGGFDATAGAQLGFAILSDIEAYFFINAAQGDKRSNVLQAPKVTLFNGQQAMVSDTSQSPFVISVIPVVGDFAAAQQPVIVVLNEGTNMTVQAVVSRDRRFVRLTVVPFFSKITAVNTFQFTGTSTTTTDTTRSGLVPAATDPAKLFNTTGDNTTNTNTGTTVQLPTFSYVTVTTTVSVPDGGTVLLGGIKRLSEGRNEFGVPLLNKLPYINRLFQNVAIGRETQSLMMMVTPRIIIQEEEEEKMGNQAPP